MARGIEDELKAMGFEILSLPVGNGSMRRVTRAVCQASGAHDEITFVPTAPPEQVRQHFAQRGWSGFGKRLIFERKGKTKMAVTTEDRNPSIANIVKILAMLDQHFGDGRYVAGWDDKRIAKELGLSETAVVKVRNESPEHGPIKGDPEIDAIRSDVEAVKGMLAQIEGRLKSAEKRICG